MREGVEQYLGKARNCSCGRVHETPLKRVVIEPDAIRKVPDILKELGYHRAFLVADQNTWRVAGETLEQELKEAQISCESLIFQEKEPVPDEKSLPVVPRRRTFWWQWARERLTICASISVSGYISTI